MCLRLVIYLVKKERDYSVLRTSFLVAPDWSLRPTTRATSMLGPSLRHVVPHICAPLLIGWRGLGRGSRKLRFSCRNLIPQCSALDTTLSHNYRLGGLSLCTRALVLELVPRATYRAGKTNGHMLTVNKAVNSLPASL